jgi:hypothetical protein
MSTAARRQLMLSILIFQVLWTSSPIILSRDRMWLWMGFGLMIGFMSIAYNSAWLQFTIECYTLYCSHLCVNCRCLVAACSDVRSLAFGLLNYSRSQLPNSDSNSSHRMSTKCPQSRFEPRRKHSFQLFRFLLLPWKHVCLRSRYLLTFVV